MSPAVRLAVPLNDRVDADRRPRHHRALVTTSGLHIVVAEPYDAQAVERLRGLGTVTTLSACDAATLAQAIGDCDALLVRTGAQVSADLLARAARLKVIGRAGVGLENIDVAAARARGIEVVYTPEAATDAVADLTVGLLLAVLRDIPRLDREVRAGRFAAARAAAVSRELGGLTLGIVGLGRIGRAVARRCRHGFGTRILYNDIVEPGFLDFVATGVTKEELYAGSDVVSLHVPLTDLTRHLIEATALGQFKPGAILINTARGAVVDSLALTEALTAGRLAGAGLDVVEPEPLPTGHPLLTAPGVVFTPHIGARTQAGLARMHAVVEDVAAVLTGGRPKYPAPHSPLDSGRATT
ncbi:MAG TPA: hydroxyacid dehydrogenase [Phycisphaerae bacterium]|nr:hydroxyacid dehydrogenase [Phycisphaerae bacterium]HNU46478.1 hydroxyacid dehydrogenase [Phycisphaerae bacterium]